MPRDYQAIFNRHIIKRAGMILDRIHQAGSTLPPTLLEQALHSLDYALTLPEAWPQTRQLLLTMAPKMEQAGYRDEWTPYLERGVRRSRQVGDLETEAELHLQLGVVSQLRSNYEAARRDLETSVNIFARLDAPPRRARALNRLALVAQRQGRFAEATTLVETALHLLAEEDPEQAYSYFVLGLTAIDKRAWPEAIEYCERALRLWEEQNDRRMIGRTLTILGSALRPLKRFAEAVAVYERAIALLEEVNDPVHKAMSQMNLGNIYLSRRQSFEALKLFLMAEKIFRRVQDRLHLAHARHNMGMAYFQLQAWNKAEAAYLAAIEQYEAIDHIAWLVNSMDEVGLLHQACGRPAEAKRTFEEALSRLDQIEGQPRYQHLWRMVADHLREVDDKPDDQSS